MNFGIMVFSSAGVIIFYERELLMTNKISYLYDHVYHVFFGMGVKVLPYSGPVKIDGEGSLKHLKMILRKEGKRMPLVVTGPRIVKSSFFQEEVRTLDQYAVFSDVHPDPTIANIEEIVSAYHLQNCDCMIAVGGGSNMDAAKAAAARIACPDKTLQEMGGLMKVRKKTPLLIAVPTTAGTGSECTVASVVIDEKTHHKYAVNDPVLCPSYAILDPSLLVSLPPHLTAATGMDALTHAVEAYLNMPYHRKDTARLCEDAVVKIFAFLPVSYEHPDDLTARKNMLEASYEAGMAITTAAVGNVHACAHTIGGLYHVQHGIANAVLLPIILEDYGRKIYKPLARLAKLTGIASGDEETCAKAFIKQIRVFNKQMDLPDHIEGIREEDLAMMAQWAVKEANPLYPVPVIYDEAHFIRILKKAGNL